MPASAEDLAFTRGSFDAAAIGRPRPGIRLAAGIGVAVERGASDSLLLLPPVAGGAVPAGYSIERTTPGVYVELLVDRGAWVFELGSRLDDPESVGVEWSPRLGVAYRLANGRTRVRASAGRAFKLPSFFALASPAALGGNPDLLPEEMVGFDAGVEHRFDAARLDLGLTVFSNRYENLVDFDFATFSPVNRAEVEARGIELELAWRPRETVTARLSATWQDVEDPITRQPLKGRADRLGSARLLWRPRPRWAAQLDLQGVAETFDQQIPVPERDRVAGRLLAGAGGSVRVGAGWRIQARIENLAGKRYETLIGFPGAGRSLWIGLRRAASAGRDPAGP